jgi:SSS family solute:Na+ symporter
MMLGAWYLTEAETRTLQDAATILASLLGGGLLSMYLIGFLTRRGDARAVWAGIVATMLFTAWTILSKKGLLPDVLSVPFDLYYTGIIGNVVMFVVVYFLSSWFRPARPIDELTIWKE